MKKFKATVNSMKEYSVTKEDFEEALIINDKLKQNDKYYGICPYCDSPVRLVGLTYEIIRTPFAQHTENSIAGVAEKTVESFYCPANTHKKTCDIDSRLQKETPRSLEIKKIFIENFDVIAKIINTHSDIYYSKEEKKKLFINACKSKIWLFPEISESNIPFILLYCKQPEEITKKLIKVNSNLYNFLKNLNVELNESFIKDYVIIAPKEYKKVEHIQYSFTHHRRTFNKNDDYTETIHALVTKSRRFEEPPVSDYYTFADEKIIIDHQELYNKINYYNRIQKRDTELLAEIING